MGHLYHFPVIILGSLSPPLFHCHTMDNVGEVIGAPEARPGTARPRAKADDSRDERQRLQCGNIGFLGDDLHVFL